MDLESLLPAVNRSPVHYRQAASDPRLDPAGLDALADSPYPFVRLAVAEQPRTAPGTLLRILDSEFSVWDTNHLLHVVAGHPRADREVLLRVLERVAGLLTHRVVRPYSAVLALAGRAELEPAELQPLATTPGTSRRVRRQLAEILAARG
ncbi:hypothetical protein KZZ52_13440 [Dactylosporangium sp. AC04546]|uniref:hypothetical protein n=1 Tax=Dactylosporangium sp. AC04546 TaxID=2862460 RepID=UPI001EDFFC96|nr:hypothetical protein [Dactylosporangium sp. AC04546]WVK86331.1 hypothetical protein KZZ52_13440 [Dactylosporangium sp. AC04546]